MQKHEVFAVSAKFSVRNPGQERNIAAIVAKERQVRHITCASGISGGLNFIRRTNSAYFNAAVWSLFTAFAEEMERAFSVRRISAPVVILKADGGTLPLAEAKQRPVEAIFTGPAASVLGVMAMQAPNGPAVSVDIGGTTTDISLWRDGAPLFNDRGEAIEGLNTSVRAFRLRSVGIGGDSFVRREDGSLKVGPRRKGPSMCLGGQEPALTDAFVVLGLSSAGSEALAIEAMRKVSGPGQSPQDAAKEALKVACESVCAEIRAMLADEAATPVYRVEDIVNDRPFEPEMLVGVGGAAEALAPAIAAEMGITCRVPAHAEVANALGAALSRSTIDITLRADTSRGDYTVPELNIRHALPKQRFLGTDAAELARTHLVERASRAGIDVAEIVTLQQEEFNVIRGFSTTGKILTVRQQVKPGVLDVLQEGGEAQ
jgi:N-methylhydantoinase A/oxoprolinase/acetone carboxylase beta subunit